MGAVQLHSTDKLNNSQRAQKISSQYRFYTLRFLPVERLLVLLADFININVFAHLRFSIFLMQVN